jgi:alpha-amylase
MKKLLSILLIVFAVGNVSAKKIKFAVDMSGIPISPYGMHLAGSFQTIAGYTGGDFAPNTTSLTQEVADTNIYSIILDIPAFAEYEYYFVNGDQGYEAEFVPEESRVQYNFNSNRWIYLDSLANDTTFVGAVKFGANAPFGKYLLRFKVDMQNEASIAAAGVHVVGSFQNFNPATCYMYSFDGMVYEYIAYIDTFNTTVNYRFVNGTNIAFGEILPGTCNVFGNREITISTHTQDNVVCFSSCVACIPSGIAENSLHTNLRLYPNPSTINSTIEFNDNSTAHLIQIVNAKGQHVLSYQNYTGALLQIDMQNFSSGIYLVLVQNDKNEFTKTKLIKE